MYRMKRTLSLVLLLIGIGLNAQVIDSTSTEVNQDPKIDSLLQIHQEINSKLVEHVEHDGINGYRIQLNFNSGNDSRERVSRIKSGFERRYPNVPTYLIYREPYFKLRVGDFRTKLEAEAFLKRINGRYRSAFVVKDKIKFPKL